MKFEKFIDDIRDKYSEINVSFQEVPFGDSMRIQLNTSKQGLVIDTTQIDNINYDSEEYKELLEMCLNELNKINSNDGNYKSKFDIEAI